jgi:hypothetical protein
MKYSIRCFLPLLGIASLLWFTGCGDSSSPVAPVTAADEAAFATGGQSLFVVSSLDVQPAGKTAGRGKKNKNERSGDATVTETIGQRGGKLSLSTDGPKKHDKLEVTLSIPRNAIPKEDPWFGDELITMSVAGSVLSELVISFDPSGLYFLESAVLTIRAQKDFNDLEPGDIAIIHYTDDDGDLIYDESDEAVVFGVDVDKGGTIIIKIQVDGFSRYSLPRGA